ncbi:MAG: ComF family protein [Spirochaetaceae bacterium]|nr:ComF family protein [Spirochaetaceae bacterium]
MKIINLLLRGCLAVRYYAGLSTLYLCGEKNCIVCGGITDLLPVCAGCFQKTIANIRLNAKRCLVCGRVLVSEKSVCVLCRSRPSIGNLNTVFPLYNYYLWARDLLFMWKMQNNRYFSFVFARQILAVLQNRFSGIPVVPVPPRPSKLKNSGWDQVKDISDILQYKYKMNVLNLLRRCDNSEQKKLGRNERLGRAEKRYVWNQAFKGYVPRSVVLLDDIMTTGATLNECAVALKAAGVETVHAVTLFTVSD